MRLSIVMPVVCLALAKIAIAEDSPPVADMRASAHVQRQEVIPSDATKQRNVRRASRVDRLKLNRSNQYTHSPRTALTRVPAGNQGRLAYVDRDTPRSTTASVGSTEESPALEAILVTAQKYQQPAYEVPVTLQVVGSSTLSRFGVLNIEDLLSYAPGVSMQDASTTRRIFIDGVGNTTGTGAQIALYIDEADATASPDLFNIDTLDIRTYDMQRVEVLHGPQGTLYGEGAEGGAIHFVTNKPDLNDAQFGLTGAELWTKGGQPSEELFPLVNIPVVPGALGIRIAGEYDHLGGYINQPQAGRKAINSQDLSDTRLTATWNPFEPFSLDLMEIIHRNLFGLSNTAFVNHDTLTFPFGLDFTPTGQDQYDLSNAVMRLKLPNDLGTITDSATFFRNHTQHRNFLQIPYSTTLGEVAPIGGGGDSSLANELRYSGNHGSHFRWTVGGLVKHTIVSNTTSLCEYPDSAVLSVPDDSFQEFNSSPGKIFCLNNVGQHLISKAYAPFIDLEYSPISRVTLGAGARYFHDQQAFYTPYPAVGAVSAQNAVFKSTDPRYYILYKLTPRLNTYASAAKGFRSGGFNQNNALFGTAPPFQPESLWRYEVGVKAHGFQAVSASISMYVDDWSQYQIVGFKPDGQSFTSNTGNVRIRGADGELVWFPVRTVTVSLNASYADPRVRSTEGLLTYKAIGDRLDEIPSYSYTAAVQNDFKWFGKPWFASLSYYQRDRLFDSLRGFNIAANPFNGFGPGYLYVSSDRLYLLNFAVGVQWTKNVSVSFKVENLLNDRANLLPDSLAALGGGGTLQPPLTGGIYLSWKP